MSNILHYSSVNDIIGRKKNSKRKNNISNGSVNENTLF